MPGGDYPFEAMLLQRDNHHSTNRRRVIAKERNRGLMLIVILKPIAYVSRSSLNDRHDEAVHI